MQRAVTWHECCWYKDGYMSPTAMREFVAKHNWDNPQRMYDFATSLYDLSTHGRDADTKRVVVAALRDLVAYADKPVQRNTVKLVEVDE